MWIDSIIQDPTRLDWWYHKLSFNKICISEDTNEFISKLQSITPPPPKHPTKKKMKKKVRMKNRKELPPHTKVHTHTHTHNTSNSHTCAQLPYQTHPPTPSQRSLHMMVEMWFVGFSIASLNLYLYNPCFTYHAILKQQAQGHIREKFYSIKFP